MRTITLFGLIPRRATAWAALWIGGMSCAFGLNAHATPELDRRYAFEATGYLRSWDNVDGLFGDYVDAAYKDYFAKQTRFRLQKLTAADPVLTESKIPYHRVIDDPDILKKVAQVAKIDNLIRTKGYKEGRSYRFVLDWFYTPRMEVIGTHTLTFDERVELNSDELKAIFHKGLDALFAKVPFRAGVTGRDRDWVTINLGKGSVSRGDLLVVGTLDDVRVHPLLKTIENWVIHPVGRLEITEVEERMAFAKVVEESEDREIAKYQKIMQIIPASENPGLHAARVGGAPGSTDRASGGVPSGAHGLVGGEAVPFIPPRLGWASAGLWLGSYGREYATGNIAAPGKQGGGLLYGAKVEGQLWLTSAFFAEVFGAYGMMGYGQSDLGSTGAATESFSGSIVKLQGALGYHHVVGEVFSGPKGWAKVGYRTTSFSLAATPASRVGPFSVGTAFVAVGAEVPIRDRWGAWFNFDLGLLKGPSDVGFSPGEIGSSMDVSFYLGGYYRWEPKILFRLGVEVLMTSASYVGGESLAHRVILLNPAVLFYF